MTVSPSPEPRTTPTPLLPRCDGCRHRDTEIAQLRAERDGYRGDLSAVRAGLQSMNTDMSILLPVALTTAARQQADMNTLSALILGLVYTVAARVRSAVGMP